ncbi:hypothetical protein BIV57_21415 [Mangrovactinospora gilvigrisea]|uniref:ABC transmembrane type-1 domain-containing protein n=1 Tax=Mangrovactinospora gilvigrisea TaxID=1428644 RepID=A0A1J7BA52_9ACTN|nr:ABC transporter permease subunit [Mangrovactinospora gilvigrisea]OIV35477.1 hypothetical protein BIV57_21415 [Mangrovactinospora gilvigrisea]
MSDTARRAAGRLAPVVALAAVLAVWQAAHALHLSAALPSLGEVAGDLAGAARDGTLLPSLGGSVLRTVVGFAASVAAGVPLGLACHRWTPVRVVCAPVLNALQALPAAALVPVATILLGGGSTAVYGVVLLGAVPSVAVGMLSAADQIPPLLRRAARTLGLTGARAAREVLLPAALPGVVAALRQGWTFGWRALMTAEVMNATPLTGIGSWLNRDKENGDIGGMLAAIAVVLAVGIAAESLVFRPIERRVLRARGLDAEQSRP